MSQHTPEAEVSVSPATPEAEPQEVLISKELFDAFHEGLMMGHSHGPSGQYRVEISHKTLEQHQVFYQLLYDLFNPTPLECPMCDAPKAFSIYPYDPSTGYCSVEDKSWTIRLGPAFVPAINAAEITTLKTKIAKLGAALDRTARAFHASAAVLTPAVQFEDCKSELCVNARAALVESPAKENR